MKNLLISIIFFLVSYNSFCRDGEIWFYIEDNTASNYRVEATRLNNNDPLFGADFMEVDTDIYNFVVCNSSHLPAPYPWDFWRGYDYLRNYGNFPEIGEGKLQFALYRDEVLVFKFKIDLVHAGLPPLGSPDLNFEYNFANPNVIISTSAGITTQISYDSFVNCWTLRGETRNISYYVNQINLTNLVGSTVENSIKTTFNSAPMGFPDTTAQVNIQYNPGTVVNLWRGVYYNISTSHTSYVKNGVNYNFRNWENYNNYSSSSTLKVEDFTDKFSSRYYQTQPLTVLNNLEGGNSIDNFNLIWQNPNPDITTTWPFGTAYYTFSYQSPILDLYSIEAPSTFQNLNTTWWFNRWNDGTTNNTKQGVSVAAPTTITAYYKGHFRSNSTSGISSNSQRKMVRTDNGIYHLVYESMGNVYYTHSLTSNFDGSWSQEELLMPNAKNPAIEYDVNKVKIVFEFFDPQNYTEAAIYMATYSLDTNGNYSQVSNECEIFLFFPASYFGNAKPIIAYTIGQLVVIYRKNSTEGLKEKTRWTFNDQTILGNENTIPETNLNSINPAVVSAYGNFHLVFESLGTIKYKYASISNGLGPWNYFSIVNVSTGSGFTTNTNPSISLSLGSPSYYVMIGWKGVYSNVLDKKLLKENDYGIDRSAAVFKSGYGLSWGGTCISFNDNVNFVNSGSLNTSAGSILTWSESNGQYNKFVKRNSDLSYGIITNLLTNNPPVQVQGIHPVVSNGSSFNTIKTIVYNPSGSAPYLFNKCTNDFSQSALAKIGETGNIGLSYGRSGVVEKNGIEFLFNIGDVLLNGQTISFIERVDTLPVANIEELNFAARTESFNLSTQSELIFSNYYYVVNKNLADSVLADQFNVSFKCELVNASTNQVVGTFDNITYNKFNVQKYANPSYLIDCSGIESGNYYLKLTTDLNDSVNLFLSNIQRDNVSLEKSNLLVRNFKGERVPVEYNLAQNFPNPFNPSTTIRYQIPKDGIVTLKVYDILGSEVATLVNEEKVAGKYEVNFNASSLASGVYIYKIQAGSFINSKKMILLK